MTSVTFEAGVIADAVKRAARVAPAKVGSAFDKAAGTVLDIAPGTDSPCIIRATDTERFYMETLNVVEAEGRAVRWRLASAILANVVGTLPPTAGKTVTFRQAANATQVEVTSGRMKAKYNLNGNPYYPEWDATDGLTLRQASNFGGNLTRVEWAAGKTAPVNGVHIDGTHIIATDSYRIARVPCPVELPNGPITIPASGIGQLLKEMGDVLVGVDDTLFVAMPDDYTQIKTVILGTNFPPVQRIMSLEYPEMVEIEKASLIDKINKSVQFAGADRSPIINLYIGREEVAVFMNNEEVGLFGDVIEIPGQATHQRMQLRFTPKMLLDALNNAPNPKIKFKYNPDNVKSPVSIDGDSGYEVWVAVRAEKTPTP